MDVSDPQTLGFLVFGGFMVVSAVAIVLVSTLSMKETSYEEALANQRRRRVQAPPPRGEKKKKDKTSEKKGRARRKEEQAEGRSSSGEETVAVTCTEPESDPEPAAEPQTKPEPEPEPEPKPEAKPEPGPEPGPAPAPSPKDRKKKRLAKVEPAAVMETIAKEMLVMAVAPVVDVATVTVAAEVAKETTNAKTEETKESSGKKKKSKNKPETGSAPTDASSLYGELMSAVSNMTLSDEETNKLMTALKKRSGDTWQLACQRGDQLSSLKKQLEEKEKLLATQQEAAAAAKDRLRELSKERAAEKSKMASLEASLKAERGARGREVGALKADMEAAEREHVKHREQLNQKILGLQDQLENGPNAQLARLQQENSILRDALNQATSQAESRQNAELARLRQDCVRLNQDLMETRTSLEDKMAAAEQELAQVQRVHSDTELSLQQRLQEVSLELAASQQEAAAVSELQAALASRDAELQDLKVQLENQVQNQVQVESPSEVEQLKNDVQCRDEQVGVLEAELSQLKAELKLMTSQSQRVKEADEAADQGSGSETDSEQPFESLETDSQLLRLEDELHQARNHGNELQEKLSTAGRLREQKEAELNAALTEAESRFSSLRSDFQASMRRLFPDVAVEAEQSDWLEVFTQKAEERKRDDESAHSELQVRLKGAEHNQTLLQVELDQNIKLLQETEAELQALKKQSEDKENVWKNKMSEAEKQKEEVLHQLKQLEEEDEAKKTETEKQVQSQLQQMSLRLQVEQEQRQQLDRELQQARQQVSVLQQQVEAEPADPPKEAAVELKEETSV